VILTEGEARGQYQITQVRINIYSLSVNITLHKSAKLYIDLNNSL